METAICKQPAKLALIDPPMPEVGPGDVLLRVQRVGVCGNDLHIFTGDQPYLRYPRVMGTISPALSLLRRQRHA